MIHRPIVGMIVGLILVYHFYVENEDNKIIKSQAELLKAQKSQLDAYSDLSNTQNNYIEYRGLELKRLKKELKLSPLTAMKYRSYVQEKSRDKKFLKDTGTYMEAFINEDNKKG